MTYILHYIWDTGIYTQIFEVPFGVKIIQDSVELMDDWQVRFCGVFFSDVADAIIDPSQVFKNKLWSHWYLVLDFSSGYTHIFMKKTPKKPIVF